MLAGSYGCWTGQSSAVTVAWKCRRFAECLAVSSMAAGVSDGESRARVVNQGMTARGAARRKSQVCLSHLTVRPAIRRVARLPIPDREILDAKSICQRAPELGVKLRLKTMS